MEEVKRESPVVLAVALALPTLCRDPSKALCVTLTLRTSFHYDRRARGPFLRNFGYNGAVSDEGTGPSGPLTPRGMTEFLKRNLKRLFNMFLRWRTEHSVRRNGDWAVAKVGLSSHHSGDRGPKYGAMPRK